jgi:predicted TPR repeat methyltransferase
MKLSEQQFLQRMTEALRLHRGAQRPAAIALYQELYRKRPAFPPLLNLLGLALTQEGRVLEGLPLMTEAVRLAPDYPDGWLNLAFARQQAEDRAGARIAYQAVLQLQPANLTALLSLASLVAEVDTGEAVSLLRRAAQVAPERALPWLRLRRLCQLHGDPAGVAEAERRVEALKLVDAEEWAEVAGAHVTMGRNRQAIPFFQAALQQRPDLAVAALGLGIALRQVGNYPEALEALRRAAALAPRRPEPWINIGQVNIAQGNRAAAAEALQEALKRKPTDSTAQHLLDAALGKTSAAPPPDYVRRTFDDYAASYDALLVNSLGYRAPQEIAALLVQLFPGRRFARFFDLGCGTGLVGKALAEITGTRVGLDLSRRMLDVARNTGLYYDLIEQEAVAFLGSTTERFDLFVAAELLVYLGDLQPLFEQVSHHLLPGGVFVVTTEVLKEGETGEYVLRASGRYAHDDSYLHRLAKQYGFRTRHFAALDLRREQDGFVRGSLAVFQQPG